MIGSLVMLISITLMYSTPFVFGGMAGVISERSGVTNIGIEGMMTIGAFAGVAGSFLSGNPSGRPAYRWCCRRISGYASCNCFCSPCR